MSINYYHCTYWQIDGFDICLEDQFENKYIEKRQITVILEVKFTQATKWTWMPCHVFFWISCLNNASNTGGENSASAQNPQPSRSQAEMSDMQLRDWVDSLVQNPEGNLTSTERQKVAQSQTSSPARDSQIRPNLGTGFRQKTSPKRNVPQSPSTSSIDPDDWGSYGVAEESEVKSNLPARQSDQFDRVPTPASKNPNGQKTAIRPWQSSRPNLQSNNRNFQQNAQGPMFSYRGQQNQNRPVQNSNRYPQNLQNQNTRYAQNPRYPQNNRFPPARPQMASRTEDSR